MTNIATLFTTYPDAAGLLKGLYVMNGYFDEAPLPEPYYNWNSWADPLASKIVFSSNVSVHRAIPLEVTDTLTIEAKQARVLLNSGSDLMKSVFSFGGAWLEKSEKLTLHDPLAAVSVFYPDICSFERGNVQVETNFESNMGGTSFAPSQKGNVEIARIVDREQFYRILSTTLCGENKKVKQRHIPQLVVSRAKSVGTVGEAWLANLDNMVSELEKEWHISVEDALSGGTHALVANAELTTGDTSWFNEFLESGYEKLNHPCPRKVIEQALVYLKSRTENEKPDEFVMLHGDAHGENTLKSLTGEGFKFIDPDGIFYEKAYDLGVLMREWREEYEPEPMKAGKERCSYLHHLTSVPEQEIWEWGYIQMVSTAFVMLQIGQEETGHKMLHIAECWNNKSNPV